MKRPAVHLSRRSSLLAVLVLISLLHPSSVLHSQELEGPQGGDASIRSDGSLEIAPPTPVTGEPSFEGRGFSIDRSPSVDSPFESGTPLKLSPARPKVGEQAIIGTDDRTEVDPTTTFPARAVALITLQFGESAYWCTGWLYGPNVVATAGHCVHSGGPDGVWANSVYVYPGQNGLTSPYGVCAAKWLASVVGWVRQEREDHDYGAIKLDCSIGTVTGWFGYFWQPTRLTGQPSTINGYPGDKPLTQWQSRDRIRYSGSHQLFYANDTIAGMSGSPVYGYRLPGSPDCAGYCAMAIHGYGLHGRFPHNAYNHGVRIRKAVVSNLKSWKDRP